MAVVQNKYLNFDDFLNQNQSGRAVNQTAQNQLNSAQNNLNAQTQGLDNSIGTVAGSGAQDLSVNNTANDQLKTFKDKYDQTLSDKTISDEEQKNLFGELNRTYSGPNQANIKVNNTQTQLAQMMGGNSAQRKVAGQELTGGNYSTLDDFLNISQNRGQLTNTAKQADAFANKSSQINRVYNDKIAQTKTGLADYQSKAKDFLNQQAQAYNSNASKMQQAAGEQSAANQDQRELMNKIQNKIIMKQWLTPDEQRSLLQIAGYGNGKDQSIVKDWKTYSTLKDDLARTQDTIGKGANFDYNSYIQNNANPQDIFGGSGGGYNIDPQQTYNQALAKKAEIEAKMREIANNYGGDDKLNSQYEDVSNYLALTPDNVPEYNQSQNYMTKATYDPQQMKWVNLAQSQQGGDTVYIPDPNGGRVNNNPELAQYFNFDKALNPAYSSNLDDYLNQSDINNYNQLQKTLGNTDGLKTYNPTSNYYTNLNGEKVPLVNWAGLKKGFGG